MNEENLGFTIGNNRAMEQILNEYEYIVLLNNDTELDENWLENLVAGAIKNNLDIEGSKLVNFFDREKIDNIGHTFLNTGEVLPYGTAFNPNNLNGLAYNAGACAAAILLSTKMLKDIGMFDEYFNTGYEDVELSLRALLLGYNVATNLDAIVYHKVSVSVEKIRSYEYSLRIYKSILYTYFKLMPWQVILLNFPFMITKYVGLIVIGIVLRRKLLYEIPIKAMYHVFKNDTRIIKKQRKDIQSKRKMSVFNILKLQKFFLKYYWEYFVKYIIGKKKTVLERHG